MSLRDLQKGLSFGLITFALSVPLLAEAATNTNSECILLAEKVMANPKTTEARNLQILVNCLLTEVHDANRGPATQALHAAGERSIPLLITALKSKQPLLINAVLAPLSMLGPRARSAASALKDLLVDPSPAVRQYEVAQTLGKIGEVDYLLRIAQGFYHPRISPILGLQGLAAAGSRAGFAAWPLTTMLTGPDKSIRLEAANTLGYIGPEANRAIPQLSEMIRNSSKEERYAAGEALLRIGTPESLAAAGPYQQRKNLMAQYDRLVLVFTRPSSAILISIGLLVWSVLGLVLGWGKNWANGSVLVVALLWGILVYLRNSFRSLDQSAFTFLMLLYPVILPLTLAVLVLWFAGVFFKKISRS